MDVDRFEKQVLRCNCCGVEVTNNQPINKWEHSARSSIVLQKVNGCPFNRMARLQSQFNIPVAPSTLWQQCSDLWEDCGKYIYQQLLATVAESKVFYLDDTRAKILEVIKANKLLPKKAARACNTIFHYGECI